MNALQQYDVEVDRLELVRNSLNGIFHARTSDRTSYLLRICLPEHHDRATIESEIMWLRELARSSEIDTPEPIPARDGAMVVTASADGVPEPRRCVLFSWLRGRDLHRSATPEEFAQLGKLMAKLHAQTDQWYPPPSFQVRTLNRLYPFGDPQGLLGQTHERRFDAATHKQIAHVEERVGAELERLYQGGNPQVLHADLHWGNVKVYRGRLQPLDFEDLAWGFPIQDIAISLFYSLNDERFPDLRAAFRRGYASARTWPEEFEGQLDLLIVHRAIDLFNYLLTANFPGEERWFPAFVRDINGRYREMLDISA
jgi:Ser/Thr protein kinase RdoA (MazF antagonist)